MPILDLDSLPDNKDSKPITLTELRKRFKENHRDPELKKFNKEIAESLSQIAKNYNSYFASSVQNVMVGYNQNFIAAINEAIKPNVAVAYLISEALHPTFVQLASEMAESQRKFIESITIPNYLFESIRIISEQINNQLYEPIRLLSQSFAMYKTPNLFNELTHINTNWIMPGYVPTKPTKDEDSYTRIIEKETEILREEIENLHASEPKIIQAPYVYYEPTKFLLLKVEVAAVIQFQTKRGTTNVIALFEVLHKFLEEKGKEVGDFKSVFISTSELISELVAKGVKNPTEYWIKNTKNSFINHKVRPLEVLHPILSGVVKLWYDNKASGYYFQIRVKTSLPQLD